MSVRNATNAQHHRPGPWFVKALPNRAARFRLFCLPYAGGGAMVFRDWARQLPDWIDVCPIELPGRGTRLAEPLITAFAPMVRAVASAIAAHLDRPFGFFGHSMGAAIVFELTRHLRRYGWRGPDHLFVAGRRAPQLPPEGDPACRFAGLPKPEFIEELKRLKGTPPEVFEHEELLELFVPILRADFALCQSFTFTPEPPLACPISVYGGEHDEAGREAFEAWGEMTTGPFTVRMFPGDHFFVNTAQALFLPALVADIETSVRIDRHASMPLRP
jgi:medium-chain acyl-[acyl-carrier-protein] hydrolase